MSITHRVYLVAGWKVPTKEMSEDVKLKFRDLVDYYHEKADQSKNVMAISDQWSGKYYLIGHVFASLDPEQDAGEKFLVGNYNRDLGEEYSFIEAMLPMVKGLLDPDDMEFFLISHSW